MNEVSHELSVVEKYLTDFKKNAKDWFNKNDWLLKRYEFFNEFFKSENIKKLEWHDIQMMGPYIHSYNSMKIAQQNALGRPNHTIEHYREVFEYLVRGNDPINVKLNNLRDSKSNFHLKYFGKSALSELVSYAFADKYVIYNRRDVDALNFLGISIEKERGDKFGDKFLKYNEAMKIVILGYEKIVGKQTGTTIPLEVDQFFSWLYETTIPKNKDADDELDNENDVVETGFEYWMIACGRCGQYWKEWQKENIISIGWDDLGDLTEYATREEIQILLKEEDGSEPIMNSLACWQFSKEMKIGDYVFAKTGISTFLGYGIIQSDYIFDKNRNENKHIRKVKWLRTGEWNKPEFRVVTKTLTKITSYYDFVNSLFKEINSSGAENYYWLNANPNMWRIEDYQIGQENNYTTHNEKGNKRRVYKYMTELKPGDKIIGYEASPIRKIKAILEVTQGIYQDDDDNEVFAFKIIEFTPEELTWDELTVLPGLENCEILKNNQGSLFKLTNDEFNIIVKASKGAERQLVKYNFDDAAKEIFIDTERLKDILSILKYKKNIILQGPPGTGKTYLAKRLAYLLLGVEDKSKIQMVQFHQSYSYEDFIQGYRPKPSGGFELKQGIFANFCSKAQSDPDNNYFFIIDEINRGNLSKIFGELMMLIEHDKRGKDFAIPLTYSTTDHPDFFIPENVYIIGTMNTADRSLAMVDYALRRRFSFISINPVFNERFKEYLTIYGIPDYLAEKIISNMAWLNQQIAADKDLKQGYSIGHSYFCNVDNNNVSDEWYVQIIKNEIIPMLGEYWFDNEEQVEKCKKYLLEK